RTGSSRMTSFIGLRAIAAKLLDLFRSPDQPPLAQSPFFVGGRKVTQAVDFLTCHFRRFRSCLGPRSCPLGARKPQLDKPADGFGARRIVLLRRRPAIDARECSGLKTQADQRALGRSRRPPLLFPYRHGPDAPWETMISRSSGETTQARDVPRSGLIVILSRSARTCCGETGAEDQRTVNSAGGHPLERAPFHDRREAGRIARPNA